jgi:hypothetical protein
MKEPPVFEPDIGGAAGESRSFVELMADLPRHLTSLMRKEFDLFRAELSEKFTLMGASVTLMVLGLVMALVGLNLLAFAAVAGLVALGVSQGWALLILGVIVGLLGMIFVRNGQTGLKAENLVPRRTLASVEKDATSIKESL